MYIYIYISQLCYGINEVGVYHLLIVWPQLSISSLQINSIHAYITFPSLKGREGDRGGGGEGRLTKKEESVRLNKPMECRKRGYYD